ncbi:E3 ubiquitin-protein ligase RNF186 [Mastacembelus armatus]|uniref:E3 ubiquitin-protein ligase RNF186 n=1 Tax=Mastacembelus armatus TaxID=205130 RepID=UPI000E463C51|nr:E3 ubiquitin-protein ligase RNF186-like [Mastacembelus armatus]XP_026161010.1 E3 ubiquitin-protein ligase RNF186-like [Mastacembelus armatus]
MVLCEDSECSICFLPYSRTDRVPRMLHCRHTFCELCLQTMSQVRSGLLTVGCPLCRRVTCIGRGLSLQEALWVNSRLWDQIPKDVDREAGEQEEDGLEQEAEEERTEAKLEPSLQAQGVSLRSSGTKLKLPTFFRKFNLIKRHQERIMPGSNIEMKSWRRLSSEETI